MIECQKYEISFDSFCMKIEDAILQGATQDSTTVDFDMKVSYLILGAAFVEDGNSISALDLKILLLDVEAETTAPEKQNTPRQECQRPHIEIHSL